MGLVAKNERFSPQNGDEKGSRRQKMKFPAQKRRREMVSLPKKGVLHRKMTTRKGLVAKKRSFAPQNDDEKESRRQKKEFRASKRRREQVSSLKNEVSCPKMTTRTGLVAKKRSFLPKNDDEKWFRRQKKEFPAQK